MKTLTQEMATPGQLKQITRVGQDAVEKTVVEFGLDKEGAQRVHARGDELAEAVRIAVVASLKNLSVVDKRFGPAIKEFEITVPADYNHDTQIDKFWERVRKLKTTYYYNNDLSSQNFAKATNRLEPGKTYKVKIFPILARVESEDCLAFLRKQNAILVGGQGVTLVYDLKKEEFPVGKWTVSFDKKEALWEDADGGHGVPCVHAISDGVFKFLLGYFEDGWIGGNCLLCLCDE